MYELSLSAIGTDRPGIVAAITGVLARLGCSIEDSEMAVLRGNFAVMLVLSAPDGLDSPGVESALAPVTSQFELVLAARPLGQPAQQVTDASPEAARWSISVHGADRTGIVAAITEVLAQAGANIVELRTHIAGSEDNPLYVMVLEVAVPSIANVPALSESLDSAARALGVSVTVAPIDEEVL